MKRHYHSTIEKKPAAVIHTTIRSSKSLQIINKKSVDRDENLSSVIFLF